VHVAAIRRAPRSYEHVDPALVGNRTRFVVSELSGRANVRAMAEAHDVEVAADIEAGVLETVKEREARGFAFESAEASVALMMRRARPGYVAPFDLLDYKVLVAKQEPCADAAVKMRVRGELVHTAADGNGPVSALDAALRKALVAAFPEVERIHLEDYKVRIIDGRAGTAAITRVLIDHGNGTERWTTVGASSSILEASLVALVDGIEHGIWLARGKEERDESNNRLAAG
jgi:2-isopropylmalate synthase